MQQPINIIINNYNSPGALTPASVQTYNIQPGAGATNDPVIIKASVTQPASNQAELDKMQQQIDSLKQQMDQKKKVLDKMQQDSINREAQQMGNKKKMTQ